MMMMIAIIIIRKCLLSFSSDSLIFSSDAYKSENYYIYIYILAEIPGVARDSVRNEGTREINYGSCISASRRDCLTPGERAPVLIGYEAVWTQEPVWTLWRRETS
jgi:hypothetical protein